MLQDMLQLLKESVSSKHSERLEQIVIALIGIEIGKRHCLALLESLRLMELFFFSFEGDHNLGRSLLVDTCTFNCCHYTRVSLSSFVYAIIIITKCMLFDDSRDRTIITVCGQYSSLARDDGRLHEDCTTLRMNKGSKGEMIRA